MPAHRVLTIDDDADLRQVWSECLTMMGHQVIAAAGRAEALELLERGERPTVILLDWTLPDGRGTDLLDDLRARVPAAAVIVATGRGQDVADEVGARAAAILHKPFSLRDLMRVVGALP